MADGLAHDEEGAEALPSRRERHQHSRRSRKRKGARWLKVNETSGVRKMEQTADGREEQLEEADIKEEGHEGPERSEIFKEKRDRQGSLLVTGIIFWLFMLLVVSMLVFTIRHYS